METRRLEDFDPVDALEKEFHTELEGWSSQRGVFPPSRQEVAFRAAENTEGEGQSWSA